MIWICNENFIYFYVSLIKLKMQETIKFLNVIDSKIKRKISLYSSNTKEGKNAIILKKNKFPFGSVFQFNDSKFNEFPSWLTERDDFMNFMYKKYEKKLLLIPKICEKYIRASD
eukprot:GHVR01083609.1.p1 GENE.GHVR01083609.1~~GHVR01083609.1.p1  ORF type:complete len:114 (-),score=4.39 GHVR01083609.1:1338-1679(-)